MSAEIVHKVSEPYREWLGVEDGAERPPNAYALLGLKPLEPDANRIRQASERQRHRLERRRSQADQEQWEHVHRELEDAIYLLLEPERKAAYDLEIKRKRATSVKSAPAPPPTVDASERISCGGCNKENSAGRRFCAGCGEPLWVECLGCNAVGASSEQFCGTCGINLREATQKVLDKGQQLIERAMALGQEYRFNEAVAELSPVIQQTHQSMRQQIEQAAALMDQLLVERSRHKAAAIVAADEARVELQKANYARVIELLDAVPRVFRDAEAEELLRQAQQKSSELLRLREEIATAIQQKRVSDAVHRIERLLALDPQDAVADKVGRSLSQHLQKAASKELARHQYQACLELLEQIPTRFRSEQLARQIEKIAELEWLHADLRQAPFADGVLNEVARRLTAEAPGNEQAARLRERLEQRLSKPVETPHGQLPKPIPWVTLPAHSSLGVPIEWVTGLRRIQVLDDRVKSTWTAHPGQFQLACGLALQGLGRAAVPLDLKPKKKAGMLGNLSLGLSRKSVAKSGWGIDLSASALKAVRLVTSGDDEVVVEQCVWMALKRQGGAVSGSAESSPAAVNALRTLRESHSIPDAEPVCVNMPGIKLLGRFLRLPRIEGKRFQQVLEFEVRHRIPFPLEELSWDHHVIPDHGHTYSEVPVAVLVVACKLFEVERRLATFEEAGLKVSFLQTDAVGLHNWLQFDRPARPTADGVSTAHSGVAVLDIGSDSSQVVVSWADSLWFRVLATGGDEFTRAIVKQLRLTNEQAEQVKHSPQRAKRMSQLYEALDPVADRLRTQLKQSLDAFHQDYPEVALREAVGLGGGFGMHGLLNALYRTS